LLIDAAGSEGLYRGLTLWLGLTIDLLVQGGRELVVYAHAGAHLNLQSACELHSAVVDDIVWYAKLADHAPEEHACQFQSVDVLSTGLVDRHLSKSIDYDQNSFVSRLG